MLRLAHGIRVLFAVMYLAGGSAHLVIGIMHPEYYSQIVDYAEIDLYRMLFSALNPPGVTVLGISLALLEFCLFALILMKGKPMLRGLMVSMIYQMLLVPLGLTGIANLMIALLHAPVIITEINQQSPIIRHHGDEHNPFVTEA
jgi:hypothetical protein